MTESPLAPAAMIPKRNLVGRAARRLKREVQSFRAAFEGEADGTTFDLFDLAAVNEILVRHDVPPLTTDATTAAENVAGAMRFILATLTKSKPNEPEPLTTGSAFFRSLTERGDLSATAIQHIRSAFDGVRGERVKRVQEMREDLRDVFPLGLTPDGIRADLLIWYLHHGRQSYEITAEEILRMFFEFDLAPDRGLVHTYLLNPMWQKAVPHAMTVFGWPTFKNYLRRAYGLKSRWFEHAELPADLSRPWDQLTQYRRVRTEWTAAFPEAAAQAGDAAAVLRWLKRERHAAPVDRAWLSGLEADVRGGLPNMPGANLVGHFRYPSGLQEAVSGIDRAFRAAGSRTTRRELPVLFECDWNDPEHYRGVETFDTTIYLAAVNTFPQEWISRGGIHWRPGVHRIAVWYWELEELPKEWLPQLDWMDEVWAPTSFLAETFRKYVDVPVIPMLPGVTVPNFRPQPRSHYGLPQAAFLFLVTFDMGSIMARKNPLGAVAAFRRAFGSRTDVHLAVKVSRGDCDKVNLAKLTEATAYPNVTLINEVFPRSDTLALLQSADCYVSLHRSEGLGLGMAESMLLGKPVLGTGYSGNLDFMTADTAYLVDHDRTAIADDHPPYPIGCIWAEPRLDHAAELMARIVTDQVASKAVGLRGQVHARKVLDPADYGRRMLARLTEINAAWPRG